MKAIFYLFLSLLLLAGPCRALAQQQAPVQNEKPVAAAPGQAPATEPPVKAVPLTDRKQKPQRVDDALPSAPDHFDHSRRAARAARHAHGPGHGMAPHGMGGHGHRR